MSNPSLILPQSPAYGEDYVYAAQVNDGVVPLYNVLPLTFTRASGGTRINKDGLVQNMPYNLVEYSNTFTNAAWSTSKYNATITATNILAPDGSLTASEVVFTTDGYLYYATNSFSPLDIPKITFSIYSKTTTQSIIFGGASISGTDVYSYENVGNGWYRQSLTRTFNTTSTGYLQLLPIGSNVTKYFFGAQLNIGSTAQPYLATTDRLNMPRITYPVGGGCGALLLEKQSTNLVTYSEQFDQWNTLDASITTNQITSPDGTQNADKFVENNQNQPHFVYSNTGIYASAVYTVSVYAKAGERSILQILFNGTTNINAYANFDLTNGIAYATSSTATITSVGNGWYRCTITATLAAATLPLVYYCIQTSTSATRAQAYAGNGTSGLYLWGGQSEQSSYATSYIPTTSTSATRIADSCYKTGISNLIGQTEGTLFAEIVRTQSTANDLFWITLSDGSINNWLFFGTEGTGGRFYVRASNTVIFDQYPAISLGRHKLALAYKSGSIAVYIDGAQLFTSSSTFTIGSLTGFALGQNQSTLTGSVDTSGQVNQAILFPTRLTNAELATLTTL